MQDATEGDDGVRVQWDVRVPLRDGTQMSGILYLPGNHRAPSPVLFTLTPYTAQTFHLSAVNYASHGFPFFVVDVRGRGNSEGNFHPLNEAKDGCDIIEWLARQPYCNGKVAMWGGSYTGYCQWTIAKERPTHLVTMVPVAAAYYGIDFPMKGNVFYPYVMQWLTFVRGRALQDKVFLDRPYWFNQYKRWYKSGQPFEQLDALCGDSSSLFHEWISHPHLDDYWDSYAPTDRDYAKLTIPILTITGAYDADQPGALEYYRRYMKNASPEARARHYLIIGPWDHAGCGTPAPEFAGLKFGPASLLDMRMLLRQWYAWTLQDGPKPEFLQKNVAYYVAGAEKWRYVDSLEQITACSKPLYLRSTCNPVDVFQAGSLEGQPPASADPDHYVYDPSDVSLADFESTVDPYSPLDQRMTHASRGRQLIYHTAPFDDDVEISGFFELSVWLAIDCPDTDFRVTVDEVTADGGVIHLSADYMRARYREGLRAAKLIDTEMPLRYDFNRFLFMSRQIRKGHRLRLVIGPIGSIHFERNHNSGGVVAEESIEDARPVTVRLFHDSAHPSALYVPYGQPDP